MLKSQPFRVYIGTLQYGEMTIENYCAPTIPKKLWDKVQVIMRANADRKNLNSKTEHPRRKNSIYILSGIIKCARCGSPMNGLSTPQPYGKDYRRYNCASAKNKKTCAIKPVPAELVEKLVLEQLHIFFDDPKNLINILTTFQKDHTAETSKVDERRVSFNHQLSATRKKIVNLTNAIAEKSHSPAMLKKLTDLEEDETAILSGIEQLKVQTTTPIVVPTLEKAKQLAHNIQVDLKSKDHAFIRQTLLGILSEVIVDRFDKHVVGRMVYYHTPNVKKKLLANTMSIIPAPVGAHNIGAL